MAMEGGATPPLPSASADGVVEPAGDRDSAQTSYTPTPTEHALQRMSWEQSFELFLEAVAPDANGLRHVPISFETNGHRLGKWVNKQRILWRRGTLRAEHKERLDAAGMVWDENESSWEKGFRRFVGYPKNADGRRLVPEMYADEDGFRLGKWLANQRQAFLKGELSQDRAIRLEIEGIEWDVSVHNWERGFSLFEAVPPDRDGNRIVPQKHVTEEGFKLGVWQTTQRTAYRNGELSDQRITLLEAGGMVWDPKDAAWLQGLTYFEDYPADSHGQRLVPQSFVTADGFKLGAWQSAQRTAYRKRQLNPSRLRRLVSAGIVWDPLNWAWDEGFGHFLRQTPVWLSSNAL
jgi:hypothetical protein|tara:strand:- start:73 stop:1116 length:1044 start_codon:yes stop_codon:yes gene_type:complete